MEKDRTRNVGSRLRKTINIVHTRRPPLPRPIFEDRPENSRQSPGTGAVTYVTVAGTTISLLFPFLTQAVAGTNIGIVALVVNFIVLIAVSFATGGLTVRREQRA